MINLVDQLRELDASIVRAKRDAKEAAALASTAGTTLAELEAERRSTEEDFLHDIAVVAGGGLVRVPGTHFMEKPERAYLLFAMLRADDETWSRFKMFWGGE